MEADARRSFEEGFAFVAVGNDMGLLARGSGRFATRFRDVVPELNRESGACRFAPPDP